MSEKRLYRLTVETWPTPDGQPFDRQSDEFWERDASDPITWATP